MSHNTEAHRIYVGYYATGAGGRRSVSLIVSRGERVLIDSRRGRDCRVVERFGVNTDLLAIVAVATGYLAEAAAAGRPMARAVPADAELEAARL